MRSKYFQSLIIAAALTLFAVATSVALSTRALTASESATAGTAVGFTSTTSGPDPVAGLKVLALYVREPSFGWSVLGPQLAIFFPFFFASVLLGSKFGPRSHRA